MISVKSAVTAPWRAAAVPPVARGALPASVPASRRPTVGGSGLGPSPGSRRPRLFNSNFTETYLAYLFHNPSVVLVRKLFLGRSVGHLDFSQDLVSRRISLGNLLLLGLGPAFGRIFGKDHIHHAREGSVALRVQDFGPA